MKRRNQTRSLQYRQRSTSLLLCLPALPFIAFGLYTILFAIVMSVNSNAAILTGSGFDFVGFTNYHTAVHDPEIASVMGNTLLFAGCTIAIELVLGLLISSALFKNFKGTSLFKVCIVLPMMMAPIASGAIWRWMYTDRYGIINHLLEFIGVNGPYWLGANIPAKAAIISVSAWGALPFSILVLLAAISSVNTDMLESARIDGANNMQTYWHIIFPCLKSSIFIVLLIRIPDALKLYDIVFVMTGGGPANATQTISYYIYQKGWRAMNFGDASAYSVLLLVVIVALSLSLNWIFNRKKYAEGE